MSKIQWGEIAASQTRMAVDDIRHKLIEEGWYGKETTGSLSSDLYGSPVIEEAETKSTEQGTNEIETQDLYGENLNNEEPKKEQEIEL